MQKEDPPRWNCGSFEDWKRLPGSPLDLSKVLLLFQIVDRMNNTAAFAVWVPCFSSSFFYPPLDCGAWGLPGFRALVGKSISRRSSAVAACRPLASNQSVLAFNSLFLINIFVMSYLINIDCGSIKCISIIFGGWFPTITSLCCPFFFGFNIGYCQHACLYLDLII